MFEYCLGFDLGEKIRRGLKDWVYVTHSSICE